MAERNGGKRNAHNKERRCERQREPEIDRNLLGKTTRDGMVRMSSTLYIEKEIVNMGKGKKEREE